MLKTSNVAKRIFNRNVLMFIASLCLGLFAYHSSGKYIDDQVAYYKGQLESTEEMTEIVVPNRSIRRGEVLMAHDLSVRQIPEKYADTNSVHSGNYDVAVGQRLDFDIDEGRPLLWAHLEGGLTPTFSGKVDEGLRAMTVRVDEINSISGFLQPQDKVDLMLSYGTGSNYQIFPLIQKLDVIATGVQTALDKSLSGSTRPFSTITVHVSPADGQKITLAQQVGKLTALLRNPEDKTDLSDTPMTIADLLNQPVPIKPPVVVKQTKKKTVKPLVPKPAPVEYIIGGRS